MSERASTLLPSACSGDMYPAVPTTRPSAVRGRSPAATVTSSSLTSAVSVSFARPKSTTLTRPSEPTITFPGLKSRWTIPAACAAASASAIGTACFRASPRRMP
jgi:hypothetical protein